MAKIIKIIVWISIVFSLYLICGCGESKNQSTRLPNSEVLLHTPSVTQIQKQMVPVVPTETRTLEPMMTSTSSSTPTFSPTEPQLSDEQIQSWVLDQIFEHVCNPPCWWGITPGKTTWEEAFKFLVPYASEIGSVDVEDRSYKGVYFYSPPKEVTNDFIFIGFEVYENDILNIGVQGVEQVETFQLPGLLELWGKPDEIWVYGYSGLANDVGPRDVTLHVYYHEKHFVAHYSAPVGDVIDGMLFNCLEYGPIIDLWSINIDMSYEEVANDQGVGPQFPVLPISEALGMSVETFYEMYKGTNDDICFETPIELWQWGEATQTP